MYRMASEADDVMRRMGEGDRNELKRRLQRPKLETEKEGEATPTRSRSATTRCGCSST